MQENLNATAACPADADGRPRGLVGIGDGCFTPPARDAVDHPALTAQLRAVLEGSLKALADGSLTPRVGPPGALAGLAGRGEGHFHLAAELFIGLQGTTVFRCPGASVRLGPGELLVLPAQLLHDEYVSAGADGQPFSNLVLYAESGALSCHLAREVRPGVAGMLHLQACEHPQAARIQGWLQDVVALAHAGTGDAGQGWRATQMRALLGACLAGALGALQDCDPVAAEPALIARLRTLVRNQLGSHTLSVRSLAAQSGCTPDYLSHLYARTTGEHLVACITRLRMQRAAQLLTQGDMAVKEVAWACGYAHPSYFIRSFRAHHGCTPQAWRRARAQDGAAPSTSPPPPSSTLVPPTTAGG